MSNRILVDAIKGLYDEEAEAVTYYINDKKFCFKHNLHKWVNASLAWKKENYDHYVSLQSPGNSIHREWGCGYGGIRFCRLCKTIDCIHYFPKENIKTYEIRLNKYLSECHSINKCGICHRNILIGGFTENNPSQRALDLIYKITCELGIRWEPSLMGSYYFCEFPVAVSLILDKDEHAAEGYIKQVLWGIK